MISSSFRSIRPAVGRPPTLTIVTYVLGASLLLGDLGAVPNSALRFLGDPLNDYLPTPNI